MNKYIKEQLSHCKIARIPPFNEDTVEIYISRDSAGKSQEFEFEIGREYDIEVEDYIIHPYPGFTLHDNWNKGIIPTDKWMHVQVLQTRGKMLQVSAVGLQDQRPWTGWLPRKSCKLL